MAVEHKNAAGTFPDRQHIETAVSTSNEYILWIATVAYGLHMLEEYEYNWRDWVGRVLGLQVEWNEFYLVNAFVIILGVSCAAIGWRRPEMALSFPSFMLVNVILFHIVPVLITQHFSPGLFTAVVLFLPIAGWAYYEAWADEVLTARTGVVSGVFGFLMMMFPIVLQITKRLPFFYQGGG